MTDMDIWSNDEKRRAFCENYKAWGVWFRVPQLETVYYKYDLPNGARLVVMEYQSKMPYLRNSEPAYKTAHTYYLIHTGGKFKPEGRSEAFLSNYLMQMRKELLKGGAADDRAEN